MTLYERKDNRNLFYFYSPHLDIPIHLAKEPTGCESSVSETLTERSFSDDYL